MGLLKKINEAKLNTIEVKGIGLVGMYITYNYPKCIYMGHKKDTCKFVTGLDYPENDIQITSVTLDNIMVVE